MGTKTSKFDQNFRQNQWEEAHDVEIPPQSVGRYKVVRNRITGQLLDKYHLQFSNQADYNKYLESISYRRNEPNIVRVIHYDPKVVRQFCGSSYMLSVYLEHCRSRLSQYQDIPFPDYLYCAMAMLDGYKKLFSKIGRFHVSERQVMIDQDGEIRVWLNEQFEDNQAESLRYDDSGDYNQQEYEMVKDVMRIIFENSDISQGPNIKLFDFYERQKNNLNHRVGFQQAKNIILDYSRRNQIQIPDVFKSVLQIYQNQEDDRHHDHETMSFKNDLFNHQMPDNSGIKAVYQPVQSIVNNTSSNHLYQVGNGIHIEKQPNNLLIPVGQNILSPPPPPPLRHQTATVLQPSFGFSNQQNTLRSIPSAISQPQPQPVHVQMQANPRPFIQAPRPVQLIAPPQLKTQYQPQIQNQFQSVPNRSQQGLPINIRPQMIARPPVTVVNNQATFSSHGGTIKIPAPANIIRPPLMQSSPVSKINVNSSSQAVINTAPAPEPAPIFQNANNANNNYQENSPTYPQQHSDSNEDQDQQQYDQQQYEEKMQSGNYQVEVNEANIIKDLSELHKIQEQEKSKRSANQSSNYNRNAAVNHQKDHQNDEQKDDSDKLNEYHDGQYGNNQMIMKNSESVEQKTNFQREQQQQQVFNGQNGTSQPPTPGFQTQSGSQTYNQYSLPPRPVKHQISQPQFYSGFNPHFSGQGNFNSLTLGQQQQNAIGQFKQANIIKNQINQMQGKTQYTDNSSSNKGELTRNYEGSSRKQFYYTLSNQVELDPEIAADLAMYS